MWLVDAGTSEEATGLTGREADRRGKLAEIGRAKATSEFHSRSRRARFPTVMGLMHRGLRR